MTVGATADEAELESIIKQGGRRGEIYSTLRGHSRSSTADLIRAKYPHIPRRVSGYNLDQLLPENGFNVARALVGTEGTCVIVLEAKLKLIQSPQHRVACRPRLSQTRFRRPIMFRKFCRSIPSASKVLKEASSMA